VPTVFREQLFRPSSAERLDLVEELWDCIADALTRLWC
jgi:hypothetical protein